MSQGLAHLIERSAGLKRDLVQFAQGPRFEQALTAGPVIGARLTELAARDRRR